MRNVKCQDTGKSIPKDQAYQAPNKKYYSSEEAYREILRQRGLRTDCTNKMLELMHYEYGMMLPTIYNKGIKELQQHYGFDVIYKTMESVQDKTEYALKTKCFDSEYSKCHYFMAIIRNHINDVYLKMQREKKQKAEHTVEIENIDNIGTNKQSHSVADLLGDL